MRGNIGAAARRRNRPLQQVEPIGRIMLTTGRAVAGFDIGGASRHPVADRIGVGRIGADGVFLRQDDSGQWGGQRPGQPGAAPTLPASLAGAGPRHAAGPIGWTTDLGADRGSPGWWRGVATCLLLCWLAWLLYPGWPAALPGAVVLPPPGTTAVDTPMEAIAPAALGATAGRHLAANDLALPLAPASEPPQLSLAATLGAGDGFARALERAGVSRADAERAEALVGSAAPLDTIEPGTRIALVLGRRPTQLVPRPLDRLQLRPRLDLSVTLARAGPTLAMTRTPIAVDHTPLRLQGQVGSGLYRAARAAGAPADAVEAYLRALAPRVPLGRVRADDRFELVIDRERTAAGETRLGALLLAGLRQGGRATELVRWGEGEAARWFDPDGTGEGRRAMTMPVAGPVTSGFGMRFHPILGFSRFHEGIDIGAPWGTPVLAAMDGQVRSAGWKGGYGNYIRLGHSPALETGYGHLSRFAVAAGDLVHRGQVIGYIGSTGLSTGPHLHWEVWRDGVAIDPQRFAPDLPDRLGGAALAAFQARVTALQALTPAP